MQISTTTDAPVRLGHARGDLLQLVLVVDAACTCVEKMAPQPVTPPPVPDPNEALA